MSMKYLGESFDIHGGGRDLIFPHHENEIAQSEGVTGSQFARYWIHHGLITVNEQKMSKSLKNFVTLKQLMSGGDEQKEDLKFLFMKTHYSAAVDYSDKEMSMAQSTRNNFKFFFDEANSCSLGKEDLQLNALNVGAIKKDFVAAMDNDFNIPEVIADMHLKMHAFRLAQNSSLMQAASRCFQECLAVLGLNFESKVDNLEEIQKAIQMRQKAKQDKNYKLADEIREQFLKKGIEFVDSPMGTTWRKR
jgi:cysteinyl-tRNA synthetase